LSISAGSDVVVTSRVLGHASPSITLDVYAALFDRARHEQRATDALDRAFGTVVGGTTILR
jgi:integrase